jgi:hypothetical protein
MYIYTSDSLIVITITNHEDILNIRMSTWYQKCTHYDICSGFKLHSQRQHVHYTSASIDDAWFIPVSGSNSSIPCFYLKWDIKQVIFTFYWKVAVWFAEAVTCFTQVLVWFAKAVTCFTQVLVWFTEVVVVSCDWGCDCDTIFCGGGVAAGTTSFCGGGGAVTSITHPSQSYGLEF